MSELIAIATELQEYTRIVGSHNKHINSVSDRLLELINQEANDDCNNKIYEKLKKEANQEFENRTDATGHFTDFYNQGFCDGFEWALDRFKQEGGL